MPWGQAAQTKRRCVGEAGRVGKDGARSNVKKENHEAHEGREGFAKSEYEAPQPLFEQRYVEIHEETNPAIRQPKIRQNLSFMDARERVNGFYLDHHQALDDHIEPVGSFNSDALVNHWQKDLSLDVQATPSEFDHETLFIGGLEQARAESSMNLQTRIDHNRRHRLGALRESFFSFVDFVVHLSFLGPVVI
jgi:hypothetical protein